MGGVPSKIRDEDRIKIYKRVTLESAREKYSLLPQPMSQLPEFLSSFKILCTRPVSMNFKVERGLVDDWRTDPSVFFCVHHFEDENKDDDQYLEVDGNDCSVFLYHILSHQLTITLSKEQTKSSFLIGLNKLQYDVLYSSAFPTVAKRAK
jgi:hypothetical protein